jgi:hypothetical protein
MQGILFCGAWKNQIAAGAAQISTKLPAETVRACPPNVSRFREWGSRARGLMFDVRRLNGREEAIPAGRRYLSLGSKALREERGSPKAWS